MLKKDITYNTLDGEEITETFYFNLSTADLAELQLSYKGGFAEYLKKITQEENGREIISTFKELLKLSYGKKSEDGKRFIKSDQMWEEFKSTEAYSKLFMELVTDADAASAFINGVVPADLAVNVDQIAMKIDAVNNERAEPVVLSREDAVEMDSDELQSGLATGRYRIRDDGQYKI